MDYKDPKLVMQVCEMVGGFPDYHISESIDLIEEALPYWVQEAEIIKFALQSVMFNMSCNNCPVNKKCWEFERVKSPPSCAEMMIERAKEIKAGDSK